jgi:rare lipoprotein A
MDRKSIAVLILSCIAVFASPVRTAAGAPAALAPIALSADRAVVGAVSFYDDPQETASGEAYDPHAFTAAAQLEIRDRFGGIRFGQLYQPAYGLGEYDGKKIIVKLNDVGPLMPGRTFDLSRAAMAYFDASLEKGLLPDFRMHPLPLGRTYPTGPVTDEQLAAMGIGEDNDGSEDRIAMASAPTAIAESGAAQADAIAPVLDDVAKIRARCRTFERNAAPDAPALVSLDDPRGMAAALSI